MYGLVNRAIEDLVVDAGGEIAWSLVKRKAGVTIPGFVSMESYDDSITFDLIQSASETLSMTRAQLLRALGRHWIDYTVEHGYGALLRMAGKDVHEFLGNLDALHARVRMTLPDLEPPSFLVTAEADGGLIVRYFSERQALAPMVVGLLEGLGEFLGTPYRVEQITTSGKGCGHEVFHLQPAWGRA